MVMRSKVTLAIGVSCLASAVLGGGALAHGGGDGGGHGGSSALTVKVRGLVTELSAATATTDGSITVSPGGTLAPWTCTLPATADTTDIVVNTTVVSMKCRDRGGVLAARRIHESDRATGKVKVKARGMVTAFAPVASGTPVVPPKPGGALFDKREEPGTTTTTTPEPPTAPGTTTTTTDPVTPPDPTTPTDPAAPGTPGSITLDLGTGLPPVTCAVTDRTRVRSVPAVGDMAKIECRSFDDALVAKKIRTRGTRFAPQPGAPQQDIGTGRHKGRR
jgi:hypothetical protein